MPLAMSVESTALAPSLNAQAGAVRIISSADRPLLRLALMRQTQPETLAPAG